MLKNTSSQAGERTQSLAEVPNQNTTQTEAAPMQAEMTNPFTPGGAMHFFFENGGYSYGPDESPHEGRVRSAIDAAESEREGKAAGISYEWSIDPLIDSSDWSDEEPAWEQWQCAAYIGGECVAALHGIDFGRDGEPFGKPYKRVVEMELAAEALSRCD